ncbi:MAG TPA: TIGR03086 family metal-binding protein [Acidimicrobiales bacterium]|nr:TIGR03086 family metal-binding protein [Acidimicrobiales bacterium]
MTETNELITIGRDREAAQSALGATVDGVQQLEQIAPMLGAIVGNVTDADLERPTPCANFDVAGILEHMIGGASAFAPGFRGDGSAANPPTDGSVFERWNAAMGALMDSVHTPGAQDNTIASPFGEVSGAYFARYVALDGLTHAWDLATATGQSLTPPDALVADIDAFAHELLQPAMRDGDTFADATDPPADATPLERLVAFTGRTVTR